MVQCINYNTDVLVVAAHFSHFEDESEQTRNQRPTFSLHKMTETVSELGV